MSPCTSAHVNVGIGDVVGTSLVAPALVTDMVAAAAVRSVPTSPARIAPASALACNCVSRTAATLASATALYAFCAAVAAACDAMPLRASAPVTHRLLAWRTRLMAHLASVLVHTHSLRLAAPSAAGSVTLYAACTPV